MRSVLFWSFLAPVLISGCGWILGLDEFVDAPPNADAGADGGGGTSGGSACEPGEHRTCYSGPQATQDIGICQAGEQHCAEGPVWGQCIGEVLPGAEDCTVRGDEDCDGVPCSDTLWATLYGDDASQQAYAVAIDADGNTYVGGSFAGSVSFGGITLNAVEGDAFLVKLDRAGSHVWSRRFGSSGADAVTALAVAPDGNLIAAGRFAVSINLGGGNLVGAGQQDLWVAKLGPDAAHLWSRRFGDADRQDQIRLAVDENGHVVVAGDFEGTINFGDGDLTAASASDTDLFVAKLNQDGVALWSRRFGDSAPQYARAIAAGADGSVYIGGQLYGTVSFGGASLSGSPALFVAKLDPFGVHVWSEDYGVGGGMRSVDDLAIDPEGNVIVGGTLNGSLDFGTQQIAQPAELTDVFALKLTENGSYVWAKAFGSNLQDGAARLAVDPNGEIAFSCFFDGTIELGGPLLMTAGSSRGLAKLSPDGEHLWSKILGAPQTVNVQEIAIDPSSREIVIVGWQDGEADYGLGPLSANGSSDIFAAKLAP